LEKHCTLSRVGTRRLFNALCAAFQRAIFSRSRVTVSCFLDATCVVDKFDALEDWVFEASISNDRNIRARREGHHHGRIEGQGERVDLGKNLATDFTD
jgi:hypothetical protein